MLRSILRSDWPSRAQTSYTMFTAALVSSASNHQTTQYNTTTNVNPQRSTNSSLLTQDPRLIDTHTHHPHTFTAGAPPAPHNTQWH
jgi:hypothetical protein